MPRTQPIDVSVDLVVPARAATLYALVSDVTRMGEWSPETVRCTWLDDATGPTVGARFAGTNRLGPLTWTTKPVVVTADEGTCFAFTVPGGSGPTWSYTFETVPGGTRVTERARQARRSPLLIRALQRRAGVTDRSEHLRSGMAVTLQRLADAAVRTEHLAGSPLAV